MYAGTHNEMMSPACSLHDHVSKASAYLCKCLCKIKDGDIGAGMAVRERAGQLLDQRIVLCHLGCQLLYVCSLHPFTAYYTTPYDICDVILSLFAVTIASFV